MTRNPLSIPSLPTFFDYIPPLELDLCQILASLLHGILSSVLQWSLIGSLQLEHKQASHGTFQGNCICWNTRETWNLLNFKAPHFQLARVLLLRKSGL